MVRYATDILAENEIYRKTNDLFPVRIAGGVTRHAANNVIGTNG